MLHAVSVERLSSSVAVQKQLPFRVFRANRAIGAAAGTKAVSGTLMGSSTMGGALRDSLDACCPSPSSCTVASND